MGQLRLRAPHCIFGQRRTNGGGHVGANPTITEKLPICVETWLSAACNIQRRSIPGLGPVGESSKRQSCRERRSMIIPLQRLVLDIVCELPPPKADHLLATDAVNQVRCLRNTEVTVGRIGFPMPIGGDLCEVPEPLLVLSKCILCPYSIFDIGVRAVPFDDVAALIVQRLNAEQEPAILSVEPPQAPFEFACFPRCEMYSPLLHQLR